MAVMTPAERRASASLAGLFGLRMLGLFLVLPVFALEAAHYPGGNDAALVGIALGVYGLAQALLQIPVGLASDRFGRKPVIALGLAVFAAGSFLAAWAPDIHWLIAGRALQGAGAISAAVSALLADQTRDEVRTKAMALIGASIGLSFTLSLVLAPWMAGSMGLRGILATTGVLALLGIVVLYVVTPRAPVRDAAAEAQAGSALDRLRQATRDALFNPAMRRLYVGVFCLYAAQLAMWVAVPGMLVAAGLAKADHWQLYLPAVIASFAAMALLLFRMERLGYLRAAFLGAIGLLLMALAGLALTARLSAGTSTLWLLGACMFVLFTAFNMLEAAQPSMVSRMAPSAGRGAALGLYNTLQSLGMFVGGALGGLLLKASTATVVFGFAGALSLLWLLVAWGMPAQPAGGRHTPAAVPEAKSPGSTDSTEAPAYGIRQ
jgi:MFS family permease